MSSSASTFPIAASADLLPVAEAAFALADLREAELSSKARKALPKSAFVYPDDERYPIHDEAHAKNALSRVSANGTPAEQKKVRSAVYAKYPKLKPGNDGDADDEKKVKEAQSAPVLTAERLRQIAAGTASATTLRESAFPILGAYDLASMMRLAGELWGDSQATGSQDDEADATTIAKTVKRVIERHPEIVQIGDPCGCGPVCCC